MNTANIAALASIGRTTFARVHGDLALAYIDLAAEVPACAELYEACRAEEEAICRGEATYSAATLERARVAYEAAR